jgi:hypothetical protein
MANQEQQQFKIVDAYITADRLGGDGNRINVNNMIVELVLFENLEKPYVTGNVAILDDAGVFDGMSFSGTERISFGISSEKDTDPSSGLKFRTFIMSSIENLIKASDNGNSGLYVFTLIDEHAVLSKAKKISRTVKGSLETEIQRICTTDLNKQVDISYIYEGGELNEKAKVASIQNEFKAIIPYMHPLEACEWLRDRATTRSGCPFFLYASMHDENIRLGNLEVMLKQKAFNSKLPYIFAPSNVQKAEEGSDIQKQFQIQTMRAAKMQNTMNQLMSGGIGSLYNNTNLNTGRITSSHFNVNTLLSELKNSGVIPESKEQNVFDGSFKFDQTEDLLGEYNAKVFHTVTSSGTYDRFKSYHDEFDPIKFQKKVENLAVRNMLYKNMFEVTVPGAGFIIAKASVGDIVRIDVLADNAENENSSEKFDQLRSGDFLIYNIRHTFKNTRHDVAMTVCKLTRG